MAILNYIAEHPREGDHLECRMALLGNVLKREEAGVSLKG
jgi:hypothetical protein